MDTEYTITIEESNVLDELHDVQVFETLLNQDGNIRLNMDQIKNELTNLLFSKYKKVEDVSRKVDLFIELLKNNRQQALSYNPLIPLVRHKRYDVYEDEDNSVEVDPEYERNSEVKMIKLSSYLQQLRNIMFSRESSKFTADKLDTFTRPYEAYEPNVNWNGKPTDAMRSIMKDNDGTKFTVWHVNPADPVTLLGLVNKPREDENYHTFNFESYLEELDSIKQGDTVVYYYNDFFYNQRNNLVTSGKGKVTSVSDKYIFVNDTGKNLKFPKEIQDNFAYVYKSDSKNIFQKSQLLTHNIVFLFGSTLREKANEFILPQTITQLLYIFRDSLDSVVNFETLDTLVSNLGGSSLSSSLNTQSVKVLRNIFSKKLPEASTSRNPAFHSNVSSFLRSFLDFSTRLDYPFHGKWFDNDYARYHYLHKDVRVEWKYMLTLMLRDLQQHKDAMKRGNETLQDQYDAQSKIMVEARKSMKNQDTCDYDKVVISKEYNHYDDLVNDNGKKLFFDKSRDPTSYGTKAFVADGDLETGIARQVQKQFPKMSAKDVKFEVESILNGRRRVREGDHCVLHTIQGDVLFMWKRVNDKYMWVKTASGPIDMCGASQVHDIDALKKQGTCVVDTFDNVCRALGDARANVQFNNASTRASVLKAMIQMVDDVDDYIKLIEEEIMHFDKVLKLSSKRANNHRIVEQHADDLGVEIDDYDGEVQEGGEVVLDFNAQQQYAFMPAQPEGYIERRVNQSVSYGFVMSLCELLGLNLADTDVAFIQTSVDSKCGDGSQLLEKISQERARLQKSVNMGLYTTNKDYKARADKLIIDKLTKFENELHSLYYHDTVISTVVYVIIAVMSRYPDLMVSKVYPACVRFMSYLGYPLTDKTAPKSMNKFFACVVRNILSNSDPKFEKLASLSYDQMEEALNTAMDEVLQGNPSLKERIEMNADNLTKVRALKEMSYDTLHGFRPCFDFKGSASSTSQPEVRLLKEMHNIVSGSKHLKASMFNIPSLVNACCMEPLDSQVDYYNFFKNSGTYSSADRTINKDFMYKGTLQSLIPSIKQRDQVQISLRGMISHDADDVNINAPPQEPVVPRDVHRKLETLLESNTILAKNHVFQQISRKYSNDDWWNDDFYAAMLSTYDDIKATCMRDFPTTKALHFDLIKNMVMLIKDTEDHESLRYTLHTFLQSNIKAIVGKIINGFVITEEDKNVNEELKILLAVFAKVPQNEKKQIANVFKGTLSNLKHAWWRGDEEKDMIKNISTLAFIYITFLVQLSSMAGGQKAHYAQLVAFINDALIEHLKLNDLNLKSVRSSVEQLREQRKNELMSLYRVDDEERQLQMQLKKFGMDTWANVGTVEEGDTVYNPEAQDAQSDDIAKVRNKKEEDENYKMDTYVGENHDGDNEGDE
jgi:hypothetical protein